MQLPLPRFIRWVVRGIDPIERVRVRRAGRRIARSAQLEGAMAGPDIARLALVRALWLQTQARRSYRRRDQEATILLSRASIETGIAGVYCAVVPHASKRYEAATGQSIKTLLADLLGGSFGAEDFKAAVDGRYGKGREPNAAQMVRDIIENDGPEDVQSLNTRYYQPLSNLYLHASPSALLRHVSPATNRLLRRPARYWSGRSAVNMADTVVGLLGRTLATPGSADWYLFDSYIGVHGPRALPPQTYVLLQAIRAKARPRTVFRLAVMIMRARKLGRDEVIDEPALDDVFREMTDILGGDPDNLMASFIADAKGQILEARPAPS